MTKKKGSKDEDQRGEDEKSGFCATISVNSRYMVIFSMTCSMLGFAVTTYLVLGAMYFKPIEAQAESYAMESLGASREDLFDKLRRDKINDIVTTEEQFGTTASVHLAEFEADTLTVFRKRATGDINATLWTAHGSFIFTSSVITTIGWGNIAPKTPVGRISCMIYAIFGIPMLYSFTAILSAILNAVGLFCAHILEAAVSPLNQSNANQLGGDVEDMTGNYTMHLSMSGTESKSLRDNVKMGKTIHLSSQRQRKRISGRCGSSTIQVLSDIVDGCEGGDVDRNPKNTITGQAEKTRQFELNQTRKNQRLSKCLKFMNNDVVNYVDGPFNDFEISAGQVFKKENRQDNLLTSNHTGLAGDCDPNGFRNANKSSGRKEKYRDKSGQVSRKGRDIISKGDKYNIGVRADVDDAIDDVYSGIERGDTQFNHRVPPNSAVDDILNHLDLKTNRKHDDFFNQKDLWKNGCLNDVICHRALRPSCTNDDVWNQRELKPHSIHDEVLNQRDLKPHSIHDEVLNQRDLKPHSIHDEVLNQRDLKQHSIYEDALNQRELKPHFIYDDVWNQEELRLSHSYDNTLSQGDHRMSPTLNILNHRELKPNVTDEEVLNQGDFRFNRKLYRSLNHRNLKLNQAIDDVLDPTPNYTRIDVLDQQDPKQARQTKADCFVNHEFKTKHTPKTDIIDYHPDYDIENVSLDYWPGQYSACMSVHDLPYKPFYDDYVCHVHNWFDDFSDDFNCTLDDFVVDYKPTYEVNQDIIDYKPSYEVNQDLFDYKPHYKVDEFLADYNPNFEVDSVPINDELKRELGKVRGDYNLSHRMNKIPANHELSYRIDKCPEYSNIHAYDRLNFDNSSNHTYKSRISDIKSDHKPQERTQENNHADAKSANDHYGLSEYNVDDFTLENYNKLDNSTNLKPSHKFVTEFKNSRTGSQLSDNSLKNTCVTKNGRRTLKQNDDISSAPIRVVKTALDTRNRKIKASHQLLSQLSRDDFHSLDYNQNSKEKKKADDDEDRSIDSLDETLPLKKVPFGVYCITAFVYTAFGGVFFKDLEPKGGFIDGLYFTFIMLTTIGFGDIVPTPERYIVLLIYGALGLALANFVTNMMIDMIVDILELITFMFENQMGGCLPEKQADD